MNMFLLVRSNSDLFSSCRNVADFLAFWRRQVGSSTDASPLIGVWIHPQSPDNLPSHIGCTLPRGDSSSTQIEYDISESFGLSGIWTLCWLNIRQPGERFDRSLQREALLLSLLRWSNQDVFETDIGQFSPVFDSKDQPDLIWSEVSRLRRRYPGRITMPFVHDTQTARLYPAEGGSDRWEV